MQIFIDSKHLALKDNELLYLEGIAGSQEYADMNKLLLKPSPLTPGFINNLFKILLLLEFTPDLIRGRSDIFITVNSSFLQIPSKKTKFLVSKEL